MTTVKELNAKCKKLGLTGYTRLSKAELEKLVQRKLKAKKSRKNLVKIPTFKDAIHKIEERGTGHYHKLSGNYYAFGEGWNAECFENIDVPEYVDINDDSDYDEWAYSYVGDFTFDDLSKEIRRKGYKILHIDVLYLGMNKYGTSIALLKKNK